MGRILEKLGLRKQQTPVVQPETTVNNGLTVEDITKSLNVTAALSGDNNVYIYFYSKYFGVVQNHVIPAGSVYYSGGKKLAMHGDLECRQFVRIIDNKIEHFYDMGAFDKYFIEQNIPVKLHFSTIGLENRPDLVSQDWRTCVYRISETEFNKLPEAQQNFVFGLPGGNTLKSDIVKMQIEQQNRGITR